MPWSFYSDAININSNKTRFALQSASAKRGEDGISKSLFYHRLFRSIAFRNKKAVRMTELKSRSLALSSSGCWTKECDLPGIGGTTTRIQGGSGREQPFCSILCPPPRQTNKFDGIMGSGEGSKDQGWSLFVGRADGRVEAHTVMLDEGDSAERRKADERGVVMSPNLEENVLCFAIDTFGERLYAGGDGGILRCWDVLKREEVICLGEDIKVAAGTMRPGR